MAGRLPSARIIFRSGEYQFMHPLHRIGLPLVLTSFIFIMLVAPSASQSLVAPKVSPDEGMKREAASSVETSFDKDGNAVVTTSNTRFVYRYRTIYNSTGSPDSYTRSLLLEETVKRQETLFTDSFTSSISVQAWSGQDIAPTTPAWSLHQAGDEGGIFNEDTFYRITQYPIIDIGPAYSFYDVVTGKKVYLSSSGTLFEIDVPNTDERFCRYVAYQSGDSVSPPDECAKDRSITGVLQYGSSQQVQDRILIRSADGSDGIDGDTRFATITARYAMKARPYDGPGLMLWHTAGIASRAALSHFILHITFLGGGAYIDLPINHDKIDWNHVKHSHDIMLQEETSKPR